MHGCLEVAILENNKGHQTDQQQLEESGLKVPEPTYFPLKRHRLRSTKGCINELHNY